MDEMSHKLFLSEGSIDMASRTPIIVAEAEKWREFKPIMQQENHEAEPTVSELFHTPEVEGLPKIIPTVPCQLRNIDPYEVNRNANRSCIIALKGWRIHAIKTHVFCQRCGHFFNMPHAICQSSEKITVTMMFHSLE
ncbi:unnamed protein product [Wuchereria bancrofti]|uniref:Uncharacterized protein n=1 Tax=Wuchereria bancrofti TaxID=6293 RepID=A0A3P7D9N6_WUCBA|nr:unnamed protein product [Wuchereria bancrofti]